MGVGRGKLFSPFEKSFPLPTPKVLRLKLEDNMILDGKLLADELLVQLRERASGIIQRTGCMPVLATILVGDNKASETYVNMKGKACERVGIRSLKVHMPESTSTEELLAKIRELNQDQNVCGILLQHPVPHQIDEQLCFDEISLDKDVDGVNTASFGAMAMGKKSFISATPLSVMSILKRFDIPLAGKNVVVVGRSAILGKPVSMLLLNKDATVTICHSKTVNLPEITRKADILVAAVGKPKFIQADWVKDGVVLVDAGYNKGNVGDIDLEHASKKASAYTPVPGGVGPVTIMKLIEQTLDAAEAMSQSRATKASVTR